MILEQLLQLKTKTIHCLVVFLVCISLPSYAKAKPSYAFDKIILKTAVKEGVDPAFVHAVIRAESNYNHLAVSHAKAEGLMQLIPATAERFNVKDSFDPAQNIRGGTQYLRWLLKRFNGDIHLALAGYNAGEGAVDKYNGIPPYKETQKYVKKVVRFYRELKGLPPLQKNQIRIAKKKKQIRQLALAKKTTRSISPVVQPSRKLKRTMNTVTVSRVNEQVNTSGSFHRVSSLTVSSQRQPMNGYSRITASRSLQ